MYKKVVPTLLMSVILLIIAFHFGGYLNGDGEEPTPEDQSAYIIVKQIGGTELLTTECANKSYITETADYIIEGIVEKVESKWNEENTSIFTYTYLQIEKYVKGTPFAENNLQIVIPGGTVGEISQWVEDQPIFHEGERVRIYFKEVDGEFIIVCAQFGVEEI